MITQQQPTLPPLGPAWSGALMGTSITATLLSAHSPGSPLSYVFLAAAIAVAVAIVAGFAKHKNPRFRQPFMAPWGMFIMGMLALAGACNQILHLPIIQEITWLIFTPAAIVVAVNQLRRFHGEAQFMWGLALVTPMVAATSGAQLALTVSRPDALIRLYWMVSIGCFALAFASGVPVFIYVYKRVLQKRTHIPPALAGTTWIPLGIVGQSTAAAVLLTRGGPLAQIGVTYGAMMLAIGVPLAVYAAARFWRATLSWPAYTPGWWGSTFPVGTVSLGTHVMAQSTGATWLDTVSVAALSLLIAHWCIASSGAVVRRRQV